MILLATPVWAFPPLIAGKTAAAAASCADTSCTGFVFCQNFETATTGYDNGPETWTAVGSPDPVSASPALRGTQSCLLENSEEIYFTVSDLTEVYAFARYQFADSTPTGATIIFRGQHGTGGLASVTLATTGKLNCYSGTANNQASTGLSSTTTYYIWIRVKANTGANDGITTVTVSTTTNPADANSALGCSVTTGDDADPHFSRIYFSNGAAGGAGVSVDQLLGKTTEIGAVCN